MKEVSRDHEKALKGLELARDGIMLDVRKAWLDLKQASLSIEALRSQIEFAQENLRVVTKVRCLHCHISRGLGRSKHADPGQSRLPSSLVELLHRLRKPARATAGSI